METTPNGIKYNYSLVYSGAMFIVYPNKNTESEIKEAIKYIRDNRDVVSLRLATFEDKVELFRSDIFRSQKTKHLKYFQINDDLQKLKKCVADGLTVDFYIDTFVLPCVNKMTEIHKQIANYHSSF